MGEQRASMGEQKGSYQTKFALAGDGTIVGEGHVLAWFGSNLYIYLSMWGLLELIFFDFVGISFLNAVFVLTLPYVRTAPFLSLFAGVSARFVLCERARVLAMYWWLGAVWGSVASSVRGTGEFGNVVCQPRESLLGGSRPLRLGISCAAAYYKRRVGLRGLFSWIFSAGLAGLGIVE